MADEPPTVDAPARDEIEVASRELAERGEPHALATVVRREPPVSANVGDRALVTADGDIRGWIGGVECAQTVVASEAGEALCAGEARLVGLAPDPDAVDRPGLVARRMTCHGGGTLEVFIEPVLPATGLLLVGGSAVAEAIGRFADELGFAVTAFDLSGGDRGDATTVADAAGGFDAPPLAVVASMGEADAAGVAAAVELGSPYVGLVASDRRAEAVVERAADRLGVDPADVRSSVTVPAGVDIDARTPAEIAVSVAAELVRVRRGAAAASGAPAAAEPGTAEPPDARGMARDPVCGMAVDVESPAATVEHGGETYVFCSAGCAESFESAPEEFLADA